MTTKRGANASLFLFSMKFFFKDAIKVGILGGGQLGKMLLQAGAPLDIRFSVLDKAGDCACRAYCADFCLGDITKPEVVERFGKNLNVITAEIENVSVEGLRRLQARGVTVRPSPELIEISQDKGKQKKAFERLNLPTSPYVLIENRAELANYPELFPAVQKLRETGYDGRGVKVLETLKEIESGFDAPSVLEKKINIVKELSVIVGRNPSGVVVVYEPVEMVFHKQANMLDYLISPAEISIEIKNTLQNYALRLAEGLALEGVMAVETFLDENQNIILNEIAVRPHNSGHHTLKATNVSQFETQLRAVLNLPFCAPQTFFPAAVVNIVGEPGYTGTPVYLGVEAALGLPNVSLYLYGKTETRPYRKMGHYTVWGQNATEIRETIIHLKNKIKVIA